MILLSKRIIFLLLDCVFTLSGWAIDLNFSKRVKIDINNTHIEADHLTFKDQIAHVSGDVRFTGENFYARCEEGQYDVISKNIEAQHIDMAVERMYISAEKAHFLKEKIEMERGCIGLNSGMSKAAPHLKAEKIIFDRKKKQITAENATMGIWEISLVKLPHVTLNNWIHFWDVKGDVGFNSKLGGYIQSEICGRVYKDLRLGMLLDDYTKRGLMFGPIVKIDSDRESMKSYLRLKTGYITDHGNRGMDLPYPGYIKPEKEKHIEGQNTPGSNADHKNSNQDLPDDPDLLIPKRRWFIDMKQHHHFGSKVDLLSDLLWASDGRVQDDFKHLNEDEDVSIRDSFAELDYRGKNSLTTVFTRVKMNRYQDFAQQVPSLRYEHFPQEILDSGVYYFGYIDFTRQKTKRPKRSGSNQEDLAQSQDSGQQNLPSAKETSKKVELEAIEFNRLDGYCGFKRPTELRHGVSVTPLIGGRLTHYNGECSRFLGEIGFDFDTYFHAFHQQEILWLKAKELKHVIHPFIQFRHISQNGKHTDKLIDGKRGNNFLPCIDLSEMRHVDEIGSQSILRLGIENDLFAKNESGKIRPIASFDCYQDIRLKRDFRGIEKEQKAEKNQGVVKSKQTEQKRQLEDRFSDFYIFSEFNPRRWLNLRLYSRLNWRHLSIPEIKSEVNLISGDLWKFGIGMRFLKHRNCQFDVHYYFQLNELSRLNFDIKFDAKRGRFLASEIGYTTRLGDIWDVRLFCKIKNRSSRQSRLQPRFSITLMQW